jgi:hypothetical protein
VEKLSTEERRDQGTALHAALQTAMCEHYLQNFGLILQSNILDLRTFPGCLYYALGSPYRRQFVRSLLDAGANPDAVIDTDTYGPYTTLLRAAHSRDPACVRMILQMRASTNKEQPEEAAYSPFVTGSF